MSKINQFFSNQTDINMYKLFYLSVCFNLAKDFKIDAIKNVNNKTCAPKFIFLMQKNQKDSDDF